MQKTSYSKINLFIRSTLFFIYSTIAIFFYSLVVACSFPLPLRFRHAEVRVFLRIYFFMLKIICHIDYQVKGQEHIPHDRGGVVMSKHQSTWETFFLPLIFHDPAVIVKRELLWIPFFGWGLAASDPIAINRSAKSSAMQQVVNKGKKCLDQGRWVLVFPEGTRIPPGMIGKYKLGGARLAQATGYPVVPVAHNAGRFWGKRKFIKYPGTVQLVIGPVIESTNRTPEEILTLTKNWIEETMARL